MRISFTEHPQSVGETYTGHMRTAFGFSAELLKAGFACLVHGILPFLFETTGSRTISRLHDRMVVNRAKQRQNNAAKGGSSPAGASGGS